MFLLPLVKAYFYQALFVLEIFRFLYFHLHLYLPRPAIALEDDPT